MFQAMGNQGGLSFLLIRSSSYSVSPRWQPRVNLNFIIGCVWLWVEKGFGLVFIGEKREGWDSWEEGERWV